MKQLAWFFLGGLACLIVQFFFFGGDDRRVEIAIGPDGEALQASETSWGLEMRLVHTNKEPLEAEGRVQERLEVREPKSQVQEHEQPLGDSREWRRSEGKFEAGRPLAYDGGRRRRNPPTPGPKWTQEPELAEYYNNGQLHFRALQVQNEKGTWVREGPWEAWHENGQLHEAGAYLRGREQGHWSWWYDNGQCMAKGEFVEGERTGPWTYWHENGSVMMKGDYRAGKGSGRWTHYDENGAALKYVQFEGGEIRTVEWL